MVDESALSPAISMLWVSKYSFIAGSPGLLSSTIMRDVTGLPSPKLSFAQVMNFSGTAIVFSLEENPAIRAGIHIWRPRPLMDTLNGRMPVMPSLSWGSPWVEAKPKL